MRLFLAGYIRVKIELQRALRFIALEIKLGENRGQRLGEVESRSVKT